MKMFKQGLMWADAIHSSLIWPLCLGGMERRMTKSGEIHKEFKATILEPSTGEELKKGGGDTAVSWYLHFSASPAGLLMRTTLHTWQDPKWFPLPAAPGGSAASITKRPWDIWCWASPKPAECQGTWETCENTNSPALAQNN